VSADAGADAGAVAGWLGVVDVLFVFIINEYILLKNKIL
jgi:hypothetical protein